MRESQSAFVAVVFVTLAALPPALGADKPKELIIGKWAPASGAGKGFVAEFTKDGKVVITGKKDDQDVKFEGSYKFVSDDDMELTLDAMGEKITEKLKIAKIDKDEMVTVDSMQKEEKFKRLK